VREIRMLRATWRGMETWHGRDTSANWRASPRPYLEAVLRSLIAPQVAREFFSLEAISSPWAVDRPAKKDPSLPLGQACPGSEQEGPARVAQCPHKRRSGARGRCLFAHRGKPGWHSAAVFEQLRPAGVMVLSAVCPIERAATWRRGGGHRYVPCAINAVRAATKNAGLPCLVPAGRAAA
jgi:hypothetical protein